LGPLPLLIVGLRRWHFCGLVGRANNCGRCVRLNVRVAELPNGITADHHPDTTPRTKTEPFYSPGLTKPKAISASNVTLHKDAAIFQHRQC